MYLFSSATPQRTAYSKVGTISDGDPLNDWQSTVGWGDAGLQSGVTTIEP